MSETTVEGRVDIVLNSKRFRASPPGLAGPRGAFHRVKYPLKALTAWCSGRRLRGEAYQGWRYACHVPTRIDCSAEYRSARQQPLASSRPQGERPGCSRQVPDVVVRWSYWHYRTIRLAVNGYSPQFTTIRPQPVTPQRDKTFGIVSRDSILWAYFRPTSRPSRQIGRKQGETLHSTPVLLLADRPNRRTPAALTHSTSL